MLPRNSTSGIDYIGKNHGRSKKNIVLTNHALINGNVVLNLNIVAQYHVGGYNYILTDVTIVADLTICH